MKIAAKCAIEPAILKTIEKAGIDSVELYTRNENFQEMKEVTKICKDFPFSYAVHAPTSGFEPETLVEFISSVNAKIVVCHNIYWEDEWERLNQMFQNTASTLCIENIATAVEPFKIIRRYGMGYCLDLEHLQMEICGISEDIFLPLLKRVNHIHMTGYTFASSKWHTHIHESPEQSHILLNLLQKVQYSGMIVSEAAPQYQTLEEFKNLKEFYLEWEQTKD